MFVNIVLAASGLVSVVLSTDIPGVAASVSHADSLGLRRIKVRLRVSLQGPLQ